jgi:hypothetical protein
MAAAQSVERRTTHEAATGARKPGTLTHGGYWLVRIMRSGAPSRRSAVGRRFEQRRLAYALARGYTAWSACPAPLQAAIDNAIRLEFFVAALFSGFWSGGADAVPRAYLTAGENLRRQLGDLGLEPATVGGDVAALLAAARKPERT